LYLDSPVYSCWPYAILRELIRRTRANSYKRLRYGDI
jgi:hypothetical protein